MVDEVVEIGMNEGTEAVAAYIKLQRKKDELNLKPFFIVFPSTVSTSLKYSLSYLIWLLFFPAKWTIPILWFGKYDSTKELFIMITLIYLGSF